MSRGRAALGLALLAAALLGAFLLGERRRATAAPERPAAPRDLETTSTISLDPGPPGTSVDVGGRVSLAARSEPAVMRTEEYRRERQRRIAAHRAVRERPIPHRTGWVEGRLSVMDGAGSDRSAWKIYARVLGSRKQVSRPQRIDAAGFFLVEGLPPATVRIEAFHPTVRFGCSADVQVWEGAGTWVELTYEGPDPARCLSIDVDSRSRSKLEGAHLVGPDDRVHYPSVERNRSYVFVGLDADSYRFFVSDPEGTLHEGRPKEDRPIAPGAGHRVLLPSLREKVESEDRADDPGIY